MYESLQEHVCGFPVSCIGASVVQGVADADNDGVADATDNCPSMPNPGQQNADAEIDNGPNITPRDVTVPNGIADNEGDACETDGDTDNDGLPDASEAPLAPADWLRRSGGGHPNPAGGDVTNDDNANGTPAPADAADNGPSWDTDNDGALDGAECLLRTNPRTAISKPTTSPRVRRGKRRRRPRRALGSGGEMQVGHIRRERRVRRRREEGLCRSERHERRRSAELPGRHHQLGEGRTNSLIGKTMDFDLNGDGAVNFPGDTILSAKMANHVGGICL